MADLNHWRPGCIFSWQGRYVYKTLLCIETMELEAEACGLSSINAAPKPGFDKNFVGECRFSPFGTVKL